MKRRRVLQALGEKLFDLGNLAAAVLLFGNRSRGGTGLRLSHRSHRVWMPLHNGLVVDILGIGGVKG